MGWSATCFVCLTACQLAEINGSLFTLRREGNGGQNFSLWLVGV